MTDNEIIKALECCNRDDYNGCGDCPFYHRCINNERLSIFTLDLINRQKEEIDRLTDSLNATIAGQETLQRYIAIAKAEAIKEFAERLKEKAVPHYFDNYNYAVEVDEIDNLVKEMVGDEDG